MKWWQKLLHYAHESICDENGQTSSKRVAGLFGIILSHLIIAHASIASGVSANIKDCWEVLILTDGALLGITTIAKTFQK